MGFRTSLAVLSAKVLSFVCRLAGKQGMTTAGRLALMIDPNIVKKLSSQVRGDIFIVCGTNGKTTTNNLLASALEAEGKKEICNRTGANMLRGIAAAFVLNASLSGKIDADCACLEVDEAWTVRLMPFMKPDYMILTNLFRDQLDRYGEIDITMDFLEKAVDMAPGMKLIINGDDSLSAYLAEKCGHPYAAYGISEQVFEQGRTKEIREGRFCKHCGGRLEYDFYHYSQMGVYHCPACGFSRPKIDFDGQNISMKDGLSFDVCGQAVHADYRGFYNIYNILAVFAALSVSGHSPDKINDVLRSFRPQTGRNERFVINGVPVLLNLAKNPAGFNQNITAVMEDEKDKDIIIVINDNVQDGRDVSWLWDVDFDRFSQSSVRSVTVSGIRGRDMQLRMKYVDIPSSLEDDVKTAVRKRLEDGCGNLYVLVNYSALYSTHDILSAMQKKGGGS